MWTGRFQEETSALLRRYSESVSFDWRLYRYDIRGSIAHAGALCRAGILTTEEYESIVEGLRSIQSDIEAERFSWDTTLEDLHMNIEHALTARIGPAGAKLHTARSRNDQVALDLRLYCLDAVDGCLGFLTRLQSVLVEFAGRYPHAILPGYTHLQRAQPVLLGHHLLAYVEMLERDKGRLHDARDRMNVMPLGSGALAGSTIVLDRDGIAKELGFAAISRNSMDAVSDRDFVCELLFALAMIGVHLSRLGEDVILWTTSEFGFLRLSDAFTTGSSLMPQKKNPDIAELARGKSGRLLGNLTTLLVVLKGLPMTYNRDLQEDKECVFDSVDTVTLTLEIIAAMFEKAEWQQEHAATAANDPLLMATDLADYLVLKGMPFRQAHETVGALVATANEGGIPLNQLATEQFQAASPLFGNHPAQMLEPTVSIAKRRAIGAPSPENVAKELVLWRERLGHR